MSEEYTGKVKWFDTKKGFGFIDIADMEEDAFVHYSAIREDGFKDLSEGQAVQFELEQTDKGLNAVEVVKV